MARSWPSTYGPVRRRGHVGELTQLARAARIARIVMLAGTDRVFTIWVNIALALALALALFALLADHVYGEVGRAAAVAHSTGGAAELRPADAGRN